MTVPPEAIAAEDAPWPSLADWKAAARTDGAGPDARRKILVHGASLAAPVIAAAERERILRLARQLRAVIPADEGSRAPWASFADYIETTEPAPGGTP